MAERDGDCEHARPLPARHTIEIAHQLREAVVGIELLDDELQERARPGKLRGACGEVPQRTRTKLLPPAIGVELLLRSGGVFEVAVDVDDRTTDLTHGCTSNTSQHARNKRVPINAEGLGRPRGYGL